MTREYASLERIGMWLSWHCMSNQQAQRPHLLNGLPINMAKSLHQWTTLEQAMKGVLTTSGLLQERKPRESRAWRSVSRAWINPNLPSKVQILDMAYRLCPVEKLLKPLCPMIWHQGILMGHPQSLQDQLPFNWSAFGKEIIERGL